MDGAEFPYSVTPDDKPIKFHMNVQDQIAMYKDNEKHQKAPNNKIKIEHKKT